MARNGIPGRPGSKPGQKGGGDALVLALATGCSVPDAAKRSGLAVRTVYRRLEDRDFRQEVAKARDNLLSQVVGLLLEASCEAVATLRRSLKSKCEGTRNLAAGRILEHMFRGVETAELVRRIQSLEDR